MKLENPFVTFGYAGPEYFCDRVEETAKLVSAIANDRNVTLIAPRRLGKTGLIKNVFHQLQAADAAQCVYVDLYATHNLNDFITSFATQVFAGLENGWERAARVATQFVKGFRPNVSIDPMLGTPTFSFDVVAGGGAEMTLKQIFDYLETKKKKVVIALDEFQQVTEYHEKGVEGLLRSFIQFAAGTRFIFAGSRRHMMEDMFMATNRPFYHSTQIVKIGEIDMLKYYEFADSWFKKGASLLPEAVFFAVYRKFAGITWNVQQMLNRLYEIRSKTITTADVSRVIGMLVDEFSDEYARTMNDCHPNDCVLAKAIAKEGCVASLHASEFAKKYLLPPPSSVNLSIERLLAKQIVYKTEKGYVIYDRLMGIWLTGFADTANRKMI